MAPENIVGKSNFQIGQSATIADNSGQEEVLQTQLPENISTPREMQGLSEVKEIACGEYNTLMLQKDGYAYGVGENSDGQLGTGGATTITSPTYMKNSKTGYSLSGIKHIASAG